MLNLAEVPHLNDSPAVEDHLPIPGAFVPATVPNPRPRVLIVDDESRNIKLLSALLVGENYQISSCRNGREALHAIVKSAPDLILLDIMMPGIDGIEVCRRLKQDEATRAIPVVMVTALRDRDARTSAVEAGADDFLNKPVSPDELRIRVKSLLRIKSYHDRLALKYREIEEQNQQMQDLERTKEGLIHMIIHDLNNPLTAISSTMELLTLCEATLSDDGRSKLKTCLRNCTHLEYLIRGLLDIHRLEDGQIPMRKQATNIACFIKRTLEPLKTLIDQNDVQLNLETSSLLPLVPMDHHLIQRVVANIVRNALHHTPPGGELFIHVTYCQAAQQIVISIRDTGEGVAPEEQGEIFNKFQRGKNGKNLSNLNRHGLGLAFCKLAVEAHGGTIWVESDGQGKGAEFRFALPAGEPTEKS
ncbi:MAG: response regulator [Desulfobacterales bacterium]